jgi:hypothetical protein
MEEKAMHAALMAAFTSHARQNVQQKTLCTAPL